MNPDMTFRAVTRFCSHVMSGDVTAMMAAAVSIDA